MVLIEFPDRETEKKALAFLVGRFSGKVLRGSRHIVPEAALEALAHQNIPFAVKGNERGCTCTSRRCSRSSPRR